MESNFELTISKIENAVRIKKRDFKSWLVVADRYLKYYSKGIYERHWTAEDIIFELIGKLLQGERIWDPEKAPDFNKFIFNNIQSIVEGKLRSRRIVETVDDFYAEKDNSRAKNFPPKGLSADNSEPGEIIDINDKLEECYNMLIEDDDCALVFLEWKEDKTSKEIAESLGIEVADVERIKKRIRYKLNKKIN